MEFQIKLLVNSTVPVMDAKRPLKERMLDSTTSGTYILNWVEGLQFQGSREQHYFH